MLDSNSEFTGDLVDYGEPAEGETVTISNLRWERGHWKAAVSSTNLPGTRYMACRKRRSKRNKAIRFFVDQALSQGDD